MPRPSSLKDVDDPERIIQCFIKSVVWPYKFNVGLARLAWGSAFRVSFHFISEQRGWTPGRDRPGVQQRDGLLVNDPCHKAMSAGPHWLLGL